MRILLGGLGFCSPISRCADLASAYTFGNNPTQLTPSRTLKMEQNRTPAVKPELKKLKGASVREYRD